MSNMDFAWETDVGLDVNVNFNTYHVCLLSDRLRSAKKFKRNFAKTNKFKISFIHYILAHYQ